jgi:hypothetical protein
MERRLFATGCTQNCYERGAFQAYSTYLPKRSRMIAPEETWSFLHTLAHFAASKSERLR